MEIVENKKFEIGGNFCEGNDCYCDCDKYISTCFCISWFSDLEKGKNTLLHSYHYDKVSPSDKKVFCKMSGCGVSFVGIGLLATAIIIGITDSPLSFIAFALGFVSGLALLIYAGAKYNR